MGVHSRRRFLLLGAATTVTAAAGGLVLVDRGVLPGKRLLLAAEGACDVAVAAPADAPGDVTRGAFASTARRTTVAYTIVQPPTVRLEGLRTCLFLHGRGDRGSSVADDAIAIPRRLAAYVNEGGTPFAIVGVDGGESAYWHRRASGEDPGAMLTDELLPRLAGLGLGTDRIGLLGLSMGGYGALLWGETLGPSRVAAIGAMSPALWANAAESAPGAFDSAADFDAHDVFAGRPKLGAIPTRIDVGTSDPFAAACAAFLMGAPPSVTARSLTGAMTPRSGARSSVITSRGSGTRSAPRSLARRTLPPWPTTVRRAAPNRCGCPAPSPMTRP